MLRIFRHLQPITREGPSCASAEPVRIGSIVQSTDASEGEPMRTGSSPPLIAVATPVWRPPKEHAAALLDWVQRPGGKVGEVPAGELMAIHAEMCGELFWQTIPWIPVAKAFRDLIGDKKRHYSSKRARRILVYHIPDRKPPL